MAEPIQGVGGFIVAPKEYFEVVLGGRNPYMEAIEGHLDYLRQVLQTRRWSMLRRVPPCFTWEKNPLQNMRTLVIAYLRATVAA